MADHEIEVDTDALHRDTQYLRTQLNITRHHWKTLQGAMDTLNSMWSGPANQTMRTRFQKDEESVMALCGLLERLIGKMEEAERLYGRCAAEVREIAAGSGLDI